MGRAAYPLAILAACIVIAWPPAWPLAVLAGIVALAVHAITGARGDPADSLYARDPDDSP